MRFIDLFAGIGGFHLALEQLGMSCVFASEIDEHARDVYLKNFNISKEIFNKDIRTVAPEEIPDHDILCAGFPCQPFSQAGHKRGFNDVHSSERGNLFYYIADIIRVKRPHAFILENVRHLLNHDNGKTFKIIRDILENELDYTVYYKVIKASDFGRPQHRPRIYIVGFNNQTVSTTFSFQFPDPIPLKMTMSDVWEGNCSKKIGFTLRVGGKGSSLDDRRNWDGYIVDGKEVRLTPLQGKRMMGYPDDFILSESKTQAMKQLGNSVCVDVVKHIGYRVKDYLSDNLLREDQMTGMNKGEWSELLVFLQLLVEPKVYFGNTQAKVLNFDDYVVVFSAKHNSSSNKYIFRNNKLRILHDDGTEKEYFIPYLLDVESIKKLKTEIRSQRSTFQINDGSLLHFLEINGFKGASNAKQDITISFDYQGKVCEDQGMGIKSFIGSSPTLLNASSTTNFIYRVEGFDGCLDDVNNIVLPKSKIKKRIELIKQCGGKFVFERCEKQVFHENLKLIDSELPSLLSRVLLDYYSNERMSYFTQLVHSLNEKIKITRMLEIFSLGMFPGSPWDGKYASNGIILITLSDELLMYHMIKRNILNDYLFENTKLDTASTTRYGFGALYKENGQYYFKLNLQIRNC